LCKKSQLRSNRSLLGGKDMGLFLGGLGAFVLIGVVTLVRECMHGDTQE
jgi:hypothetical protein